MPVRDLVGLYESRSGSRAAPADIQSSRPIATQNQTGAASSHARPHNPNRLTAHPLLRPRISNPQSDAEVPSTNIEGLPTVLDTNNQPFSLDIKSRYIRYVAMLKWLSGYRLIIAGVY